MDKNMTLTSISFDVSKASYADVNSTTGLRRVQSRTFPPIARIDLQEQKIIHGLRNIALPNRDDVVVQVAGSATSTYVVAKTLPLRVSISKSNLQFDNPQNNQPYGLLDPQALQLKFQYKGKDISYGQWKKLPNAEKNKATIVNPPKEFTIYIRQVEKANKNRHIVNTIVASHLYRHFLGHGHTALMHPIYDENSQITHMGSMQYPLSETEVMKPLALHLSQGKLSAQALDKFLEDDKNVTLFASIVLLDYISKNTDCHYYNREAISDKQKSKANDIKNIVILDTDVVFGNSPAGTTNTPTEFTHLSPVFRGGVNNDLQNVSAPDKLHPKVKERMIELLEGKKAFPSGIKMNLLLQDTENIDDKNLHKLVKGLFNSFASEEVHSEQIADITQLSVNRLYQGLITGHMFDDVVNRSKEAYEVMRAS